jgi:hypothetical protein
MSLKEVYRLLRQVNELVETQATKIDYWRKYIPKKVDSEGKPLLNEKGEWLKIRPLGVPSAPWRIYLHMLNNIIVWFRMGREGSQHAYIPGKGVHTAWAEILEHVECSEIYEFDLLSFFDNVDLEVLFRKMWFELGLPKEFCTLIKQMNRTIIKLEKEDKLPEPERRVKYELDGSIFIKNIQAHPSLFATADGIWLTPEKELQRRVNGELKAFSPAMKKAVEEDIELLKRGVELGLRSLPFKNNRVYLRMVKQYLDLPTGKEASLKAIEEMAKNLDIQARLQPEGTRFEVHSLNEPSKANPVFTLKNKGVPQGCPTSCGLSTIILDVLTRNSHLIPGTQLSANKPIIDIKVIFYADDGVIFSNKPELIETVFNYLKSVKIGIKEEGSGFVKQNGQWLRPLKFCGLEYNGETRKMKAATRRGSNLEFDSVSMFLAYLLKRREDLIYGGSASHLNQKLDKYEGMSPKEWINNELWQFLYYRNPAKLLFEKSSGYFMSALYSNSWILSSPVEKELLFKKKSWISKRWYKYQQEQLRRCIKHLFKSEFDLAREGLNLTYFLKLEKVEDLQKLWEWVKDLKGLERLKDLIQLWMKFGRYGFNFSLFRGEITWNEQKIIGSLMSLTVQNASSYACHDLLCNEECPNDLIQFVLEEPKAKKPEEYPRTATKLSKAINRVKRAFKREGGVSIKLLPLLLYAKPSNSEKYLDRRGYYPRGLHTKTEINLRSGKAIPWSFFSYDVDMHKTLRAPIFYFLISVMKWAFYFGMLLIIFEFMTRSWSELTVYEKARLYALNPEVFHWELSAPPEITETHDWLKDSLKWLWSDPERKLSWTDLLWDKGPVEYRESSVSCECCGTLVEPETETMLFIGILGVIALLMLLKAWSSASIISVSNGPQTIKTWDSLEVHWVAIQKKLDEWIDFVEYKLWRVRPMEASEGSRSCENFDNPIIVVTDCTPEVSVVRSSDAFVKENVISKTNVTAGNGNSSLLDVDHKYVASVKESSVSSQEMVLDDSAIEGTVEWKNRIMNNYLESRKNRHSSQVWERWNAEWYDERGLEMKTEKVIELINLSSPVKKSGEITNLKWGSWVEWVDYADLYSKPILEREMILEWLEWWGWFRTDDFLSVSQDLVKTWMDWIVIRSGHEPFYHFVGYEIHTGEIIMLDLQDMIWTFCGYF